MKDYKHLVNKNYREREQDMTAYRWESSSTRKKIAVACGFLVVASIFLACFLGWIEEAHADNQTELYQQQVLINQQQALMLMRQAREQQNNYERRQHLDANIILDGTNDMPNLGDSYNYGYQLGRRNRLDN